jgi:hypothetical protein
MKYFLSIAHGKIIIVFIDVGLLFVFSITVMFSQISVKFNEINSKFYSGGDI